MTAMGEKILIVDDEPFNIDLLEQELDDQGYRTCTAASGQEALEVLAVDKPDLVLLDWMMPGLNGIEVLKRMRATAEWQRVPVIMLTAKTTTDDMVRGLDAGADDYVTKPIERPSSSPASAPCCASPAWSGRICPCAGRSPPPAPSIQG